MIFESDLKLPFNWYFIHLRTGQIYFINPSCRFQPLFTNTDKHTWVVRLNAIYRAACWIRLFTIRTTIYLTYAALNKDEFILSVIQQLRRFFVSCLFILFVFIYILVHKTKIKENKKWWNRVICFIWIKNVKSTFVEGWTFYIYKYTLEEWTHRNPDWFEN